VNRLDASKSPGQSAEPFHTLREGGEVNRQKLILYDLFCLAPICSLTGQLDGALPLFGGQTVGSSEVKEMKTHAWLLKDRDSSEWKADNAATAYLFTLKNSCNTYAVAAI
jgi:hypothetical protein